MKETIILINVRDRPTDKKIYIARQSPLFMKVKAICNQCGKEFEGFKHSKLKFCSNKCVLKSNKGRPAWNRGLKGWMKHTEEWKEELRRRYTGNLNPSKRPEVREKIKQYNLGKKYSNETNKKKGHPLERNPNWKGGKTKEFQKLKAHLSHRILKWSKEIKERDNWKCQNCGCKERKLLHSHHIKQWKDYPELRFNINNGITLCIACHKEAHYGK